MLSNEILKRYAYVNCSKYRVKVLNYLVNVGYDMPKNIAEKNDIRQNHISKVLRELREIDLIECINPEARRGRLYRITDMGREVAAVKI